MNIKKCLALLLLVCVLIAMCACNKSKNNEADTKPTTDSSASNVVPEPTDAQQQDQTTEQKDKVEVSIPTDSSLADSVFDDTKEPTKPADGSSSENIETEDPTEPSGSTETTTPNSGATAPDVKPEDMTYAAFTALTPEEQRLYQESFNDLDAFFEWYNAAKEQYEKENPPIDIDGPIDLGKY